MLFRVYTLKNLILILLPVIYSPEWDLAASFRIFSQSLKCAFVSTE